MSLKKTLVLPNKKTATALVKSRGRGREKSGGEGAFGGAAGFCGRIDRREDGDRWGRAIVIPVIVGIDRLGPNAPKFPQLAE